MYQQGHSPGRRTGQTNQRGLARVRGVGRSDRAIYWSWYRTAFDSRRSYNMAVKNRESYRVDNKFKVPKKSWGSWTFVGKHVFNKLYEAMIMNPEFYVHSDVVARNGFVSDKEWKVTAWNAAFMAASIVSRGERHLLKDISTKVKEG